jgi:hypothetical protein
MRKFLTITVIALIVIGGLLFAADRFSAQRAEQEISQRVAQRLVANKLTTSSPPKVDVTGFPFLTQAAAGRFDEILVDLADVEGGAMPLPSLHVAARDVRAPLSGVLDGTADVVAAEVTGIASLTYASLAAKTGLSGLTLAGGGGSELIVSGKLALIGTVTGKAKVTVDSGHLRIQITELKSANAALTSLVTQLIEQYKDRAFVVKLPNLPFGLAVKGVEAAPDNAKITVVAHNVKLN